MQPTERELFEAFHAGYRAIDEGSTFGTGFSAYLEAIGYQRRDDWRCTCPDRGGHGHLPECRWIKVGVEPARGEP